MLEGCGSLSLSATRQTQIIDLRKTIRGQGNAVSESRLSERSLELIDLYLELAERGLNPVMPELQNTDGDPLEPHTLVFGIDDAAAAAAALDAAKLPDGETIKASRRSAKPRAGAAWRRTGPGQAPAIQCTRAGPTRRSDSLRSRAGS